MYTTEVHYVHMCVHQVTFVMLYWFAECHLFNPLTPVDTFVSKLLMRCVFVEDILCRMYCLLMVCAYNMMVSVDRVYVYII